MIQFLWALLHQSSFGLETSLSQVDLKLDITFNNRQTQGLFNCNLIYTRTHRSFYFYLLYNNVVITVIVVKIVNHYSL